MNAKSTVRLRLECLETRRVLSAVALPLVPPVAPPPVPAVLGEFHTIGGHPRASTTIEDALQNAVAMPGANPISTPLHPGDSSYAQPPASGQLSDPAPMPDFRRNGSLEVKSSVSHNLTLDAPDLTLNAPDLTLGAPDRQGDFPSTPAVRDLPDASQVLNVDPADLPAGGVAAIVLIDVNALPPNLEMPQHDLPSPQDLAGERSEIVTFEIYSLQPITFVEAAPPDAPLANGAAMSLHSMNEGESVIANMPVNRGPAFFLAPMNRPADLTVQSMVGNDVSPETAASTAVKAHLSDTLAVSDPNRFGNPASATVEASLPSSGEVNPPATVASSLDFAASNSSEGGFVTVDDSGAATGQFGNAASTSAGLSGVDGTQLNYGNWLPGIRPNLHKPADSSSVNSAARSGRTLAADVASRPAPVILHPVADSEEGGSIELAISPPTTDSGGSLPAGDATTGNAAQQVSDIRPESGVGLFCDIEVAVDPELPLAGSAATAVSYQNGGSLVVGAGIPATANHVSTGNVPPLTKLSRTTLAGVAENLPLLLGVTILVSRGGLRLEEEIPERERRLRSVGNLRQPLELN